MNTTISTSLPVEVVKAIKERHLKYNQLIMMGIQAYNGNNQLIERMKLLEEGNDKLQRKLSFLAGQLQEKD